MASLQVIAEARRGEELHACTTFAVEVIIILTISTLRVEKRKTSGGYLQAWIEASADIRTWYIFNSISKFVF